MIKNKAIDIIKTFSGSESRDFDLFLKSPFFNTNKNLVKLYEFIARNSARLDSNKITEQYLYEKTFPGKVYNYGIMKNLMSELFGLCEKFLTVISAAGEKDGIFEKGLKKLAEYNKRRLDKLFFAEYKKLEKELEYSVLSPSYYHNKTRLTQVLHEYYTRNSLYPKAANTLYPMSIYNTCFIFSTLKHDVAGMDYLKNQINYTPEINLTDAFYRNFDFDKFLKQVNKLEPVYYNHISLDIMLMKLYTEPANWENYSRIKEFIITNLGDYSNNEKWHLSSSLFNFLLNGYIAGNKDLLPEIAAIRKMQLEHVKFNTEGMGPLQTGTFRNIVEMSLILGEKDFAEEFIKKFTCELEEDKRESTRSYSMALIEESRGNNEKVLDHLRNIEFTDFQTKFSAKMVALVAFYNLGFIEQGLSAVDSLKHFIKDTHEFSEDGKKNFTERVSALEKLFKIKANPEKYTIKDVIALENFADTYLAARKYWYLSKTAELKKLM